MGNNYSEVLAFEIINKIRKELDEIYGLTSANEIRQRIHKLIMVIDDETLNNKSVVMEKIYCKVKETNGVNERLNGYLYLLYRNLEKGKISIKEAERLYNMYISEYS